MFRPIVAFATVSLTVVTRSDIVWPNDPWITVKDIETVCMGHSAIQLDVFKIEKPTIKGETMVITASY